MSYQYQLVYFLLEISSSYLSDYLCLSFLPSFYYKERGINLQHPSSALFPKVLRLSR